MATVRIVVPEGRHFVVDFTPHDTCQSLRDRVQHQQGASLHSRTFYCNGKQVPENMPLVSMGITSQHTLTTSGDRLGGTARGLTIGTAASALGQSPHHGPLTPQLSPHAPNFYVNQWGQPVPVHSPLLSQTMGALGHLIHPSLAQRTRSRSSSLSLTADSLHPPLHPVGGTHSSPNSATHPGKPRRKSVTVDHFAGVSLPSQPNPFDVIEKTLDKIEKHESMHPIHNELYDNKDISAGAGTGNGLSVTVTPTAAGASCLTVKQSSQPSSPALSPANPASSSRPQTPTALSLSSSRMASTSTFQPVLSYQSKITALEISLQELVDERANLDKKKEDERQRIEQTITERKKTIEEMIWKHQKECAMIQAELDQHSHTLSKIQSEHDRVAAVQKQQIDDLNAMIAQRKEEIANSQRQSKEKQAIANDSIELLKSAVSEWAATSKEYHRDRERDRAANVRAIVDVLTRVGPELMDAVAAEIAARRAQ